MKIHNISIFTTLILSMTAVMTPTHTFADATKGLSIAKAMKEKERGFDSYSANLKMVLISANGKESVRHLRVKTREVLNDGDQSIAIFVTPADVKGTAFLSHTHITNDDDQWLYLPSLKRVKRISASNKTAPFMGSEFSYEDLASTEVEKYKYNYLTDEMTGNTPTLVIERTPIDPHSGYSKQIVWVEKERYLPLKIEFFNRSGEKLKTLTSMDYRIYLNRFWRSHEMRMENHISGKKSVLYWSDFNFKQNNSDADFNPNRLKRMR